MLAGEPSFSGRGRAFMADSIALVINTYQQAHFLPASIESGLAQTVPFDEIIVVDDGSTDDPASVVARYPGIRLVSHSPMPGLQRRAIPG